MSGVFLRVSRLILIGWRCGFFIQPPSYAQTPTVKWPEPESTQIAVKVTGAVNNPQVFSLPSNARLLELVSLAQVKPEAFLRGAIWSNPEQQLAQQKLKLGILFDLNTLVEVEKQQQKSKLLDVLLNWQQWVAAMPVTGRHLVSLDPARLDIEQRHNRPLAQGDEIFYPSRPSTIQITGAVDQPCMMPFVALKPAESYLQGCKQHQEADPNWLFIIQPDGQISHYGIAAWNKMRSEYPAPGARLFIPLQSTQQKNLSTLNLDVVKFLATQAIP